MYWVSAAIVALLLFSSLRAVAQKERALVLRLGKPTKRVVGPGVVVLIPFVDGLRRVSIEPLSLSLPIQSAITSDEIPIQLQASLDAEVRQPELVFTGAGDWRIQLVSELQMLMKEKLEELDFDSLEYTFPTWVESIRDELKRSASKLGVEVTGLAIFNLSPRTRPE